ncbi:hypothetical protein [Emticicia sp. C21]|uniref:hypothetical protein n=1 Tax=Emticicia sp. C21 TaxID=2302915 RepID=UPI000E34479B|nr:hypothetical protein [Emticicia sp. C21]RFS13727.1 hypothetical protein D0T08_25430 [Emticicia sp. C21]
MNQSTETNRPPAITFICSVAFVWASLSIPLIFFSSSKAIGAWYPPYLAFTVVASYASAFGIWSMRKWGFYAYVSFNVINQVVLISMSMWSLFSILIPAIVIGVVYTNLKSMK